MKHSPAQFAEMELLSWQAYSELSKTEKNPQFKKILRELAAQEKLDFEFWCEVTGRSDYQVSRWRLAGIRAIRKVFGLAFTAKLLENSERRAVEMYTEHATEVDPKLRARIEKMIEHEKEHEGQLVDKIHEEKIAFMGNIVLGLNDGLVELTGALTGFAFALQNHVLVALTGLITGVSASLSMAASAYLQARYEPGKQPLKAAIYTGVAYILVVAVLIAPFLILKNVTISLAVMAALVAAIIAAVTLYGSVVFDRPWRREFGSMLGISVGVGVIAFVLGSLFQQLFGVSLG